MKLQDNYDMYHEYKLDKKTSNYIISTCINDIPEDWEILGNSCFIDYGPIESNYILNNSTQKHSFNTFSEGIYKDQGLKGPNYTCYSDGTIRKTEDQNIILCCRLINNWKFVYPNEVFCYCIVAFNTLKYGYLQPSPNHNNLIKNSLNIYSPFASAGFYLYGNLVDRLR